MLGAKHPLIDSHGFAAFTGFVESVRVEGIKIEFFRV